MSNETPTVYNEGVGVERLNALLDELTLKPFSTAALAAQTIRAALDLYGITLPILEVEGGSGGYFGTTVADGPAILAGITSMANTNMYAPPIDGEWAFKIADSDGPDDDFDDSLYLYIIMDHDDDQNTTDCYATIVDKDDLSYITSDDAYQDQKGRHLVTPELDGRSGETPYLKTQRRVGTDTGSDDKA
jgi:hypothetical protein